MGSEALVICVAEGGTSVARPDGDWNIANGDGSDEGGALYEELLQAVADAEAADPNAYVAGAVWVQGESDRNVDMDYYEPTKALLSQLQADLGADFPVTIVGLSDYQNGGDAGREHVQDAQMKLADDLAFADFLDVDQLIADADLSASEVLREDGLHYQPEFYGRIAEAILDQPSMKTALGLEAGSDGDHDAGHGDHSGGGVTMGFPMAPGVGASQEEISAFIDAVNATDETHVHDHGSPLAGEHMAALDLAPRDEASHVAIGDGDWDDPDIWSNGEVPGDGAKVLIPHGVTVNYGMVSDASLFTVRIDGKLEFETDVDSAMTFDTMLVAPNGHIEIGTTDNPVDTNVTIDLIVADNGAIDTDWDPMLLSRGIISHGRADIHGAEKDSHLKVDEDPMAGDTSVSFGAVPLGWQVGDTIVVAGTNYEGHKWDHDLREVVPHPSEDEVRVIASIEGDTVFFDDPLAFDHGTPRADLKTSVANYTRNVSVESESGDASDGFARGHVMFMHSDEVDVRYAEFHELGRTDKSEDSFDVSKIDVTFDSNVQGRYSLHLHRTGVEDLENPTILEGNSVYGSPGWGIVHHDSNAIIDGNATFDTFGAGYVAETGNETGVWSNNIAIFAEGQGWGAPKHHVDLDTFDTARSGDGFWFQGRLIDTTDNVAASVNQGYVFFHRDGDDRMIDAQSEHFAHAGALDGPMSDAEDIPIRFFSGNETFAANEGLHVVKANPNQGHDVWSHLEDLTAWEVRTGAHLEYTSHYVLSDFDLIAKEASQFSPPLKGISFGPNATELVVVDASVEGFPIGVDLRKDLVGRPDDPSIHDFAVINTTFTNVEEEFENFDPAHDLVINDAGITAVTPSLNLDPLTYKEGYPDPDARHVDITGTKTDSLGEVDMPGGMDNFDISYGSVVHKLDTDGYWTTSDGQNYFLTDVFFTDRLTGDVFVETHPVYIDENVPLGNEFFRYSDAKDNGIQDITQMPNGTQMAGDVMLGTPKLAVPFEHLQDGSGEQAQMHHGMMEQAAVMDMMAALTSDMPVLGEEDQVEEAMDQMHSEMGMA